MFFFDTLLILDIRTYLLTCGGCVLLSFLLGYCYNNWERRRTLRRLEAEREAIKQEVARQYNALPTLSPKARAEIMAILERSEAS